MHINFLCYKILNKYAIPNHIMSFFVKCNVFSYQILKRRGRRYQVCLYHLGGGRCSQF